MEQRVGRFLSKMSKLAHLANRHSREEWLANLLVPDLKAAGYTWPGEWEEHQGKKEEGEKKKRKQGKVMLCVLDRVGEWGGPSVCAFDRMSIFEIHECGMQ